MRPIKRLRKYLILTEQALQTAMTYRISMCVGLLSGMIQAFILYYIWQMVYLKQQTLYGFTLSDMVTYIFVSYVVKNLYSFYTEVMISGKIRDGSIALELIKPLNYQLARFFESLGAVAIEGIFLGILILLVGFGVFGISGPASMTAGLAFAISLILSLLVNFTLSYLIGLLSFWTTSAFGIINAKRFIVDFFSGGLVPLAFFPGWLKNVAENLPFQAIVHVPVSIYLGRITDNAIYYALGKQVLWIVLLWSAGHLLWTAATKKITIHGG